MLFSRGVWSVFGIRKTSLDAFKSSLNDPQKLASVSQLVASVRTKFSSAPSYGINPYGEPRKDEEAINQNDLKQLAEQIEKEAIDPAFWADYFGSENIQFALGDNQFGFWLVINDYEDVTDPKSKQEAHAYRDASKPFKFLSKDEKKAIEASVVASAVLARKQFPVLVDFNSELVFVASGSVDEVSLVRNMIANLGGEDFSLAWQFGSYDWPSRFLAAVKDGNKFSSEMADRADELSRFRPEEIEKLDDKMMESIVSTYFSVAELDTGLWAGLTTPARIRLFKSSDPISASNPSTAFSVLQEFNTTALPNAASVVFQSLESRFTKKGDEKQVRVDLFTIDVNDNVNLTDAGAAMLRGFDIPPFKRGMKRALKSEGQIPIGRFWKTWLSDMKTAINYFVDNVTETLKIDKQGYGLKPFAEAKEE